MNRKNVWVDAPPGYPASMGHWRPETDEEMAARVTSAEGLWSDPPSDKARAFVEELAALCEKHGVVLSTTTYDGLQVWDRKEHDGGPIHAAGIEDRTQAGVNHER